MKASFGSVIGLVRRPLAFLAITLLATSARADLKTWQAVSPDDWDIPANWDGGVPLSTDVALINNGGTAVLGVGVSGSAASLFTGSSGAGSIEISGGNLEISGESVLGYDAGSFGSAVLSSGTWNHTFGGDDLIVGYSGTGSLAISGGVLNSDSTVIAREVGSSGSVIVTGGTLDTNYIVAGGNSIGTLNISGGLVRAVGMVGIGEDSSVIVTGSAGNRGVLATAGISRDGNAGTLTVDGGIIRATSGNSDFATFFQTGEMIVEDGGMYIDTDGFSIGIATDIVGTGTLYKTGLGSLTLSGSNSNSGGTVLDQGALRFGQMAFNPVGATLTINSGTIGNDAEGEMAILTEDTVINVNSDFAIDSQGVSGSVEIFSNVNMGADPTRTVTLTSDGLSCFGGNISGQNISFVTTSGSSQLMFCNNVSNTFTGTLRVGSGITLELWKTPDEDDNQTVAISGDMVVDPGAKVTLLYYEQFGPTSKVEVNGVLEGMASGTNTIDVLTGTGSVVGVAGETTLVVHSGSFAGTITEDDATQVLVKAGAGTFVVSGSNNYTGGTSVTSGTLRAQNNHALGNGDVVVTSSGVVYVGEGVALDVGVGNNIYLEADGSSAYVKAFAADEEFANANNVLSTETIGTIAQVLGGTASIGREVTMTFLPAAGPVASDVLNFDGTGDDTFVLQMTYDEDLAILLFGSEDDVRLGWLDLEDGWVLAVAGNDGGSPDFVLGAWNPGYGLGTYGLDKDNNQVWAVLNHNSAFAAIPEPSSAALLGAGMCLLLGSRRLRGRRNRTGE